jgi:hypothetical protein
MYRSQLADSKNDGWQQAAQAERLYLMKTQEHANSNLSQPKRSIGGLKGTAHMMVRHSKNGLDTSVGVDNRAAITTDDLLRVINYWSEDCFNQSDDLSFREAKYNRLFYHDTLFEDFMLRLRLESFGPKRLAATYAVARVVLRNDHRNTGYFTRLQLGLESIAKRNRAQLRYECADQELGDRLRARNYLQVNDAGRFCEGLAHSGHHWLWHEPIDADCARRRRRQRA